MIEVGEYIRTKNGNIGKVIDIDRRNYWIDRYIRKESGIPSEFLERNSEQLKNNIVNHSKNIIDLIEVGDVIEVHFPVRNTIRKIYVDEYFEDSMILNGIINGNVILKTILTKEMYVSNCYTVERKEE